MCQKNTFRLGMYLGRQRRNAQIQLTENQEGPITHIKTSNYISVFLLIYLSSSFYGLTIQGRINIALFLATSVVTFILRSNSKRLRLTALLFFLFIVLSTLFTIIANRDDVYLYLIFWSYFLGAYLIYISIDIRHFIILYTQIMFFICSFSLVTFSILFFFPSFFNIFPAVTNKAGLTMHNLFFSVLYDSSYFKSNYGLFWEPGAYQTFINLALFFELFVIQIIKPKRALVFLFTIFTTFSTTGYLSALILIVVFAFSKRNSIKEEIKKRRKLFLVIIVYLLVAFITFTSFPDKIKFNVYRKLEAIINPELANQNPSYVSTTARTDSMTIALINLLNNPLFGVGFSNLYGYTLEENKNFLTATPLNWFGLFGVPIGIILNFCVWRWTKVIKVGILKKLFIFIFLTLLFSSQYFNMNALYLAFLLYSFDLTHLSTHNKFIALNSIVAMNSRKVNKNKT